ncbi:MAG: hypothetical protein ACI86S_002222, partial [Paracoccaceae bacterium]
NGSSRAKKERFWNNFADPLTPLMSSDTIGPERTLVQHAANGGCEPTPEVTISCCVRAQREKCCECATHGAAARQ